MKSLPRNFGINIGSLHETFKKKCYNLMSEPTASMCADIFTKGFTDPTKWDHACGLINVINFARITVVPTCIVNDTDFPVA